ncbi:MAG: hypothetical protein QW291_07265 [Thermofilaceae archaeon]
MSEVLLETKKEVSLEKLESLTRKANELRANLNALLRAIESKYSSDPRFGSLVKNLLKAIRPPEPIDNSLIVASNSLEKYVTELERGVKTLTEYAVTLDKIYSELGRLENEVKELGKWEELLKELAPHLSAEATRLLSSAHKLIQQPPFDDVKRFSDEILILSKEIRSHNRVCKSVYLNRVNELLSSASQLYKAVKRIVKAQPFSERSEIRSYEESLRKLVEKLESVNRRPLEEKLDLTLVKREIEKIEKEISNIAEGLLSGEENSLIKELEKLTRSLDNRLVSYSTLLEALSRRTDMSVDKIAYMLYVLEKRGLITLQIRLSS